MINRSINGTLGVGVGLVGATLLLAPLPQVRTGVVRAVAVPSEHVTKLQCPSPAQASPRARRPHFILWITCIVLHFKHSSSPHIGVELSKHALCRELCT